MKKIIALLMLGLSATVVAGGMEDDPLLYKVMIDQFETRQMDGADPTILEADAWIGKDLNKAWFKVDAEHVSGQFEELEIQALYSRAVAPFWDFQIGWRHNNKPRPQRDWLALGFKGLAPYLFEVDAAVFVGGNSQVAARLQAEYEYMFTQRLILTPEATVNIYSKDDPVHDIGSGLSDLQLGLRLRYEFTREFAPYVGINWFRKYGNTKTLVSAAGGVVDDAQLVVGIRAWF